MPVRAALEKPESFAGMPFPKLNHVGCVMPVGQEFGVQAIQTIKIAHGRER